MPISVRCIMTCEPPHFVRFPHVIDVGQINFHDLPSWFVRF